MSKCPNCGSLSVEFGSSSSTLMYSPEFTDGEGKLHYHDLNTTFQEYRCLKCEHRWEEGFKNSCWCGWKNER